MPESYWLETLGCPKNQVDSDKLVGTLLADGYREADGPESADLVVVNTCAFIEAARQESIDTILELADSRRAGSRLVVTGCLAERYGSELSESLPEVDLVAGFGVPVTLRRRNSFDLLNLPRPAAAAPWAYIKVAEGCDRRCGFCAIPSFRGKQRSRPTDVLLDEVDALGDAVREIVLVAQDLASWGLDRTAPERISRPRGTPRPIVELIRAVAGRVERVRLLYLYPSALDDELVDTIVDTGVPYFDLSLQHVSRPLVERMRRFGDGARFLDRIARIRSAAPDAGLRSSFILGYPGETEEDHDALLAFLAEARLDWAGFFTFSEEPGTYAAGLPDGVPAELALERLRECSEMQDRITAERRSALVGETMRVLVDAPGVGRSHREAPEIDGIIHLPTDLGPGRLLDVVATDAAGPDLWAEVAGPVDRVTDPGAAPVFDVPDDHSAAHPPVAPFGDRVRPSTFGPSALLTPANVITVARLLATPAVVVMVAIHGAGWWPFAVAFTIGASDGVDGWLARRQGTTRSGAFLDPLADKAVVLSLLFVLAAKAEFSWVPVSLIALREVGMSVYRTVAGRRGISIPARTTAKIKTLVQGIAILLALTPPLSRNGNVLSVAIWVAVAFTVVTGGQYLFDGRRAAHLREPA